MIPYPKIYCDECQVIVDAEKAERAKQQSKRSNQRYNKKRNTIYEKFYKSDGWKALRERKLQKCSYKCEECMKRYEEGLINKQDVHAAEEVHHIIPIKENWYKRFDWDNLQALCHDCHDLKHGRFQRRNKPYKQR